MKPIKSYQDLQDRNVEEKNQLWKALMSELSEEEKNQVPAVTRPTKRKRKVPAVSLPSRKSRRLKEKPGPAPSYQEDDDGEARGRSRKPGSGGARTRTRSQQQLRPRRPIITYKEEELEPLDNAIYCGPCGLPRSGGCQLHPPVFSTGLEENYNLQIVKSSLKKAGDGVFNQGDVIPEGIIFGPYPGKLFSARDHKKEPDSGCAWVIHDPLGPGVLGYVDPGVNPTGKKNWMAKVNCAEDRASQNLMAFQYSQKIFYRVLKPIPAGVELFTYYGSAYARSPGVDVDNLDFYKGKEIHTLHVVTATLSSPPRSTSSSTSPSTAAAPSPAGPVSSTSTRRRRRTGSSPVSSVPRFSP